MALDWRERPEQGDTAADFAGGEYQPGGCTCSVFSLGFSNGTDIGFIGMISDYNGEILYSEEFDRRSDAMLACEKWLMENREVVGMARKEARTRKVAGDFYDKLFGEGDRVHETFFGDGADGRKYEIEIWEDFTPGTWGQANFNYSISDVDANEWVKYRDWYFMTMDRLWEQLNQDLDELGIELRTASRKKAQLEWESLDVPAATQWCYAADGRSGMCELDQLNHGFSPKWIACTFDVDGNAESDWQTFDSKDEAIGFLESRLASRKTASWYFGKEEYEQYGDLVARELSGKTISKRIDLSDEPGGIGYEADQLGIDLYDLLRCLEGMCYNGKAEEIDDSTYRVASRKKAYNPNNYLELDDRHAEICVRAYDIFLDDAEWQVEDLNDEYECTLAIAEAVAEAAYDMGVELSVEQERELIDVVHAYLKGDGICAGRKVANYYTPASWRDAVSEVVSMYGAVADIKPELLADGTPMISLNAEALDEAGVKELRGILFDIEGRMSFARYGSRKSAGDGELWWRGDDAAYKFETADWWRVNAPESPMRDLGFDTEEQADAWLTEHGYVREARRAKSVG